MTIITPKQIQTYETRLSEEKGIKAPDVHCSITTRGYMIWATQSPYETVISSSSYPTLEQAIEEFEAKLDALPDPETKLRNEYLEALSTASELAHSLGYSSEFIRNEMLRLSENALENHHA